MGMKKNSKSKVAWPGISRGGGDLESTYQAKMRELLDDFGIILEEEAIKSNMNIFVFPLFREFNLVGALSINEILYAIAPSVGGLPTFSWINWQNILNPPRGKDFANIVIRDLGWTSVSTLSFPRSLLDIGFQKRKEQLRSIAIEWIRQVISEAERKARIVRINPVFSGRDYLVDEDLCFVLMPFREPFYRIYSEHIKPTMEGLGFRVLKSDDLFTTNEIIEDIWEYINKAKIIIADVTGRNSNVFYELGIAHTVGKKVIILTQFDNDVPFDLKYFRYFKYTDNEEGWKILKTSIKNTVETLLKNSHLHETTRAGDT